MSVTDPKSKEDLEKLQRREERGEHLSNNEKWEVDRGIRTGVIKDKK